VRPGGRDERNGAVCGPLCGEPPASGARVGSPGARRDSKRGGNLCCPPVCGLGGLKRQHKAKHGAIRSRKRCHGFAAARATRRRALTLAAGGLAATGMYEPNEAKSCSEA